MISTKQRAYLRSLAQSLNASVQIGKDGISENTFIMFEEALEAHELIKANVLKNCDYDAKEVANIVAGEIRAEIVQVIGRKFVLYKESTKNKKINLRI